MNSNLLRGKIAEKGYTQEKLAKEVGISSNSLSRKLLGKREFTLTEVVSICRVLDIVDPVNIFFKN